MSEGPRDVVPVAEIRQTLEQLSDTGWMRLRQMVKFHVYRFRAISYEDLLHAIARMLAGTRTWPRDVEFFYLHERRLEERGRRLARGREAADVAHRPCVAGRVVTNEHNERHDRCNSPGRGGGSETLTQLSILVEGDKDVEAVLLGIAEGYTAKEVQTEFNLTPQQYDAARKRFAYMISKWFPDGWSR